MKVTRASDVPDFRLWLLDQWRPDGIFSLVSTYVSQDNKHIGPHFQPMERRFDVRALEDAHLWYVTADMAKLVDHASKSLPATTLTRELIPDKAGLVVFEQPLVGSSSDFGEPIEVGAMLWGDAILIDGDYLGIATYGQSAGPWSPLGRTDWAYGADTEEPVDPALKRHQQRIDSMAEDRRWLAALFLLAGQPLATSDDVRSPRPVARRSQRRNMGSDVRLINVRARHKPSAQAGEHHEVDWTHRWIVEGFWRQQAYGPRHSLRKPVYINDFIKGPEDKPLKVRATVKVLKDN